MKFPSNKWTGSETGLGRRLNLLPPLNVHEHSAVRDFILQQSESVPRGHRTMAGVTAALQAEDPEGPSSMPRVFNCLCEASPCCGTLAQDLGSR